MKTLLFILALICGISTTFSQFSIDVQAKGSANSTWLLNKNISDMGQEQDYAPGWGSTYGVAGNVYAGIIGIGIEFNYATHNAAYEGVEAGIGLDTYNSSVNLKTLQIPLLLKFKSASGSYIEFGPQLTNISSATYTRSGTIPVLGSYETDPKDVTNQYSGSFLSGVLGLGAKIPLGESIPIGILVGIRLQYSFGDLMGVDGYEVELGSEENPPSSLDYPWGYNEHQPTQAVSGGIVIGATYTIE
jgi:hypothetical protein